MRTMKDSGLSWVGEIPSDWVAHPVYYYFGERKNKNIFGQEDNLLSLSYGRVIRKDINTNGGLLPESFNTYNIVEAGDIIIRPTDLQNDKKSRVLACARKEASLLLHILLCVRLEDSIVDSLDIYYTPMTSPRSFITWGMVCDKG